MKIMKFGGSSLANGKRLMHVADIVSTYNMHEPVVVVASAMYGVTDMLIAIFAHYQHGNYHKAFADMRNMYLMHSQALENLHIKNHLQNQAEKMLVDLFGNLTWYLTLHNTYSVTNYEYVISYGERLSSYLLSIAITSKYTPAIAINGSDVIVADKNSKQALSKQTRINAKRVISSCLLQNSIPIVTGFFAASQEGNVITLGRGGSDYSATILANALNASEVILWKEVDGVFSADPKKESNALFYSELSYSQARALAAKGAKILHPEAMKPVAEKEIIVWVKNTFYPEKTGTKIWKGKV
jgi:aspartate kinase